MDRKGARNGVREMVTVQGRWNEWRTALVPMAGLEDIHWKQPAGARRPLIHAYIRCTGIVAGEVPHDCDPNTRPHRLLVCVLKAHTAVKSFAALAACADAAGSNSQLRPRCTRATKTPVACCAVAACAAVGVLIAVKRSRSGAPRRLS